jgi:hypothetical protein
MDRRSRCSPSCSRSHRGSGGGIVGVIAAVTAAVTVGQGGIVITATAPLAQLCQELLLL